MFNKPGAGHKNVTGIESGRSGRNRKSSEGDLKTRFTITSGGTTLSSASGRNRHIAAASFSGRATIRASTDYHNETDEIFAAVERERVHFADELQADDAASASATGPTRPTESRPPVMPSLTPLRQIKRLMAKGFARNVREVDFRRHFLTVGAVVFCVIYPAENTAIIEYGDRHAVDRAITAWNGKSIAGISDPLAQQGLELCKYDGPTGIIRPPPQQRVLVSVPPPGWTPRLFVENLRRNVRAGRVREAFAEMGRVNHFHMHKDNSQRVLGTAIIEYDLRSEAVEALKLNGAYIGELIADRKRLIITPVWSRETVPRHIAALR